MEVSSDEDEDGVWEEEEEAPAEEVSEELLEFRVWGKNVLSGQAASCQARCKGGGQQQCCHPGCRSFFLWRWIHK